ncbi:FAD/NAD(P)-binding domain-containing protein, partial [Aureobasidium pullulans]
WKKGHHFHQAPYSLSKNWNTGRKYFNFGITAFYTLLVFALLDISPTLWQAQVEELGVSWSQENNTFAINCVGLAIGSVFLIPLASKYGRRPIYIGSSIVNCAISIWLAKANTYTDLMLANLISGFTGSVSEVLVQMTVEDLFVGLGHGVLTYLLDGYGNIAGDALVGVAFVRNICATAIVFAATPWMEALGMYYLFVSQAVSQCSLHFWGSLLSSGAGRTDQSIELDVLVVGGGFGGLYTLYKLRQLGLNAKIFEAGKALGGVWHWNRYTEHASIRKFLITSSLFDNVMHSLIRFQGSTGVQIVQEVAKQASDLTVFLRTPNIALPTRQRPMSVAEQNQYKAIYEKIFAATRKCFFGVPYWSDGKALDEIERMTRWKELWARGAFAFNTANYRDCMFNQKTNDLMYEFWRNKDLVAPERPPHPLDTKRPSLEQDYYECIDQDNVHLVDLKNNGIKRFVAEGVETEDGIVHKFGTVVLATGYDAITGSLTGMGLKDRQGVDLREKWKEGVKKYLGMTAPGLPNMFMVYSPKALSNGTTTIEVQADLVADMIKKMHEEDIETIEARPEAAEKWAADIQEPEIPGKEREQLNYLAGIETYERVRKEAVESWSGFKVTKKAEA